MMYNLDGMLTRSCLVLHKFQNFFICFLLLYGIVLSGDELKKVTLQLSWFDQFQFAGYYIAKEKGFYKEKGLDVEIKPFEFGLDISKDVNSNKIDFSIGREALLLEQAKNKNLVVLYPLLQSSPLVLLSTKESGIKSIKDFVGKRIMTTMDDASEVCIEAMISSENIKSQDLTFLKHTHNINDLVNKKTDIISAYISKAPYNLQKMGVQYNVFAPKDYEFDLYSDFLYTSRSLIQKDEKTVEAFKEASLKGWKYAFSNIEESVELIKNKYNKQNITKEALIYEAKELKKLAYFNTNILGQIEKNKLKRIYDLYKILGFINGKIDFENLIYDKDYKAKLTQKQKEYLKNKKEITICIVPDWMPFEAFDKNGKHIGLNKNFIDLFSEKLKTPIRVVHTDSWHQSLTFAKEKKCDLLSLANKTKSRMKYLNFTIPYLEMPFVLVTKPDVAFVNDFATLKNKKMGIPKGFVQIEIMKEKYPNFKIVEVKNIKEGLERVLSGELYGYIGAFTNVGYYLQRYFIGELKISGKFTEKTELGLGVRNDDEMLLDIFNKLIASLSEETKRNILGKNLHIKYEKEFDYNLLWKILFVMAVVGLIVLYKQLSLKKSNEILNQMVAEKTKELKNLNKSLEKQVEDRTKKLEQSKKQLQEMAFKDNLTQIYNRYYLFEAFEKFLELTDELNKPLSLLLIDIDYFKMVNDTYGHIIGDKVLKHIVTNTQSVLREDDIFIRYGGEEFIVLLPDVNLERSLTVAQKIRHFIEENPFREDDIEILITVSIGVSQYKSGNKLEKFINEADKALYIAKKSGRNQVHHF